MKVKILVDRDAAYDSTGAVVAMSAGTIVDVDETSGEPFLFWVRMIQIGEAEPVTEPEQATEPEQVIEPEPEPEPAPKRGRPPLPRDAEGNIIRE